MNTPSKEALEAARQFAGEVIGLSEVSTYKLAAIIDRHFKPLRDRSDAWEKVFDTLEKTSCFVNASKGIECALQTIDKLVERSEQAEIRVKELEHGLKHQCETCEMKSVFDGEHDFAVKMQARVKELEAEILAVAGEDRIKVCEGGGNENIAASLAATVAALRAANAELQKQEAESRRLFYAEQDKRQSVEFRCEELAGALRNIIEIVREDGSDERYDRAIAREAEVALDPSLARHAAGEPHHFRDATKMDELERAVAEFVEPAKHCEDCDPSFSCWSNGSQCRKHASSEPANLPDTSAISDEIEKFIYCVRIRSDFGVWDGAENAIKSLRDAARKEAQK